jgi:tRNA nucleotidyltransferase (CCA-adding enzyme)
MRIEKLPNEFQNARPVMQKIEQAGFEAYFVGGSVRDSLLGIPIHDVDLATSAYPEEIKNLFSKTVDTGIEHGTVMVILKNKGYEITTFRTESGYQDYRRPDKVQFVRSLSEDLKRRDFTINALAMRENGDIIDLFHGIEDLNKRLIRAVGVASERFNEDALRMMRAVRFASKLDFNIESKTLEAISNNSSLLEKIAVERIYTEFVKMMMAHRPNQGLNDMITTNMYKFVPEFANYKDQIASIANLSDLKLNDEIEVWSLMGFAFGLNRNELHHLLKKWKASNEVIKQTIICCNAIYCLQDGTLDNWQLYKTGKVLLIKANHIARLYNFSMDENTLIAAYNRLLIKSRNELAINGSILIKNNICQPGPRLGKILANLEQMVVVENASNNTNNLMNLAKKM